MAQEHSFDIVSKVNLQELRNAVQQAQKEIATRFDFKNTSASIQFSEETPSALKLTADHLGQLKSVIDVLETKLVKRGVSLKAFAWKEPQGLPSGSVKQQASLQQGIPSEKAREIVKAVKELGLKIQSRIEGDSVRVVAKQIDDLQTVIHSLKEKNLDLPIQIENYR